MKAKEMFEELGYKHNEEQSNNEQLVYTRKEHVEYLHTKEFWKTDIVFHLKEKTVWVVFDESELYDFDMKELKAINQQCKELGWLDDE